MHICINVYIDTYMYVADMHICMYTHTHITYMHTNINVYVYMCTCMYIEIQTTDKYAVLDECIYVYVYMLYVGVYLGMNIGRHT